MSCTITFQNVCVLPGCSKTDLSYIYGPEYNFLTSWLPFPLEPGLLWFHTVLGPQFSAWKCAIKSPLSIGQLSVAWLPIALSLLNFTIDNVEKDTEIYGRPPQSVHSLALSSQWLIHLYYDPNSSFISHIGKLNHIHTSMICTKSKHLVHHCRQCPSITTVFWKSIVYNYTLARHF